jgi:hydroxymethylpyrimidine pyrophosphatase-like HAD family hydrolase
MATIRLLATDLDGTLIGSANEFPLYTDFRERVNTLRERHGTIWAPCTGRSMRSFKAFFAPMRMMGLQPDFVIIRHAHIFALSRYGYFPHVFWSLHIAYMLWANQWYVREAINDWHRTITGGALGVRTVIKKKDRLRLRFDSEDAASVASDLLADRVKPYPHLKVFRYLREVDVRSVPFTKGLAVSELARHLGIPSDEILTVGNGHNDISMLNGELAQMTGCVANSEPEVMTVVKDAGGHIASKPSLSGVLEVLDAYIDGRVRSELPEQWQDPSRTDNPSREKPQKRHSKPFPWSKLILIACVIYAVLLVFASFGMVPLAHQLMAPFRLLEKLISAIFEWLQN